MNFKVFIEVFFPYKQHDSGNLLLHSNTNNIKIKHALPSQSLYIEPINHHINLDDSSDEDDNLNYKDHLNILKKFKAYSERVRSSESKSVNHSFQEIDIFDEKSSSLYANFLDIKDIKIKECYEKNREIVCFIFPNINY